MTPKPGRFWGVIGRKHLPLGKREDREITALEAVKLRRVIRRYRVAITPMEKRKFLRKSQLWSDEFTAKLFCNVEFWIERLPGPIGVVPEFHGRAAEWEQETAKCPSGVPQPAHPEFDEVIATLPPEEPF